MLKELRRSDSRKQRIKKELSPRSRERESRFSERCTKQGRMLKLKARRETLLRIMLILDLLFMHQLLEMVCLWIRRQINMRFSQKLCPPIKELKSLANRYQTMYSRLRLASIKLIDHLRVSYQEEKRAIVFN